MRFLLIALASLAVNIGYWLSYRGTDISWGDITADADAQKDLVLIALAIWLLVEGILALSRGKVSRRMSEPAPAGETSLSANIEGQLNELYDQRERFQAEIQRAREELTYTSRRLQSVIEERDGLKIALQKFENWSDNGTSSSESGEKTAAAVPLSKNFRL